MRSWLFRDVPQPRAKEKSGLQSKHLTRNRGVNILDIKITGTRILMTEKKADMPESPGYQDIKMIGNIIMWTRMGIWCLLGGFFVWLFSGISSFMEADNFWTGLTLSRLLGDYAESVVTFIPLEVVENIMYFLVFELPLYGFILGVGTLFLVIGMVLKVR